MALPTLTDFLNSWDKLIVTGMTPERSDSVMTVAPNGSTVTIEYRHQINSSTGECSTIAFLVAYDSNGNRVSLRNQTYGCFEDEEKQFHQWFAKKMAGAMEMDARRRRDLSDGIDMILAS
jgi:ribonucleotide reductase alpha subunit